MRVAPAINAEPKHVSEAQLAGQLNLYGCPPRTLPRHIAAVRSPRDVVEAVLERLEEVEPIINAFVTVTPESAMHQARVAAERITRGETGQPLLGIPVTVKDLTRTAGTRTTFGSTLYEENVPDTDDVDWQRLQAAGAILIGKTTTPEFGMLGITESRLTGVTNNPWDVSRTAGGSSGERPQASLPGSRRLPGAAMVAVLSVSRRLFVALWASRHQKVGFRPALSHIRVSRPPVL